MVTTIIAFIAWLVLPIPVGILSRKVHEAGHVVMTIHCNFCDRSEHEVSTLVVAPDRTTAICDECVSLCSDIAASRRIERSMKRSVVSSSEETHGQPPSATEERA
jgi:hypothetical protein